MSMSSSTIHVLMLITAAQFSINIAIALTSYICIRFVSDIPSKFLRYIFIFTTITNIIGVIGFLIVINQLV